MREIEGVSADAKTRRRWFHDDYFDLFVWQDGRGEVTLFQLCYGTDASERALVWYKDRGFYHDGAQGGGEIIGVGPAKSDPVFSRLNAAADALPDDVRNPVIACVREFVEKKPKVPARRTSFRREDWQKPKAPRAGRAGAAGKTVQS